MMIETAGRPNPPWKATVLRRSRSKLGVALVEILLALAGLAGIAALLQSKQVLPSEADLKKALDKLATNPVDPDANTVAGKYLAFVKGDYAGAMPYLVHSQDKTLKTLAEHELDPVFTDNPEKKVGMADEWVAGAKKFPALTTTFYDRASQWYVKAWPDLSDLWKMKVREQGRKLSTPRIQGAKRTAFPTGWSLDVGPMDNTAEVDHATARVGSYSIRLPNRAKAAPANYTAFASVLLPIRGAACEASAYVRSDGTENGADLMTMFLFDAQGAIVSRTQILIESNLPLWTRISTKAKVPENAVRAQVHFAKVSRNGLLWIDDVSLRVDGKDILLNGSFEEK